MTESRSRWDLREDLLVAIRGELLGPAEGDEEELILRPTDRYLVGRMAPAGILDPSENDGLPDDPLPSPEEEGDDNGNLRSESLTPSSIGMTFAVDGEAESITVHPGWGQYERELSEKYETETGNPRTIWKRRQRGGDFALTLVDGFVEPVEPDPEAPRVVVRGRIRRDDSGVWLVTLFLVNAQPELDETKDRAWLLQPVIRATATDGSSAVFRRRPIVEGGGAGGMFATFEQAAAELTYRKHVEFAVGHNVSVHATVDPVHPDRAIEVRTEIMPSYEVPLTESPTEEDGEEYVDLELDMKNLAEADDAALIAKLRPLAGGYRRWIEKHEALLANAPPDLSGFEETTKEVNARWRRALDRIEAGISTLEQRPETAEAFRFANRAMWQQRVRSEYARRRRRGESVTVDDLDLPENRRWYPFQLAFMLLSLESAASPDHPDRSDPVQAVTDLIWFPTGGGKTEAYLGLAAFVMALRRIEGTVDGLDGSHGVAVLMRYTLRLLTVQQFQRASALICSMEVIRRDRVEQGDESLGTTPFRIGLWVGRRATPNTTAQSEQLVAQARDDENWRGGQGVGSPAQLTSCPWCGSPMTVGSDYEVKKDLGRTLAYCSNKIGRRCPFTRTTAPDEGLPVVVVDEEIYRLLPSLIIATVDKFAQMPWRGEVQTLFGRVSGICPRHGFLSPESEDNGVHQKRGKYPSTKRAESPFLRPPDLIIQDELHLIAGPLGSLVGLYETAIDDLCSWDRRGNRVRPKVVASTATIRNAGQQVNDLFLRTVDIFPPPGLDVSDNYFSVQRTPSPDKPGRRYIGISSPGRDRPSVLIRTYVALLTAAQHLLDEHGEAADPWMTLVGYFNSLRELGGMKRLVEDDVKTRAFRIDFDEDHVPRPGLGQRKLRTDSIDELTSRKSSGDIPQILDQLEVPFGTDDKRRPIDVLLATNMVSVGVDVRRLGAMVVNGQPKTTAEYIQATSRVGRASPGVVLTVLNWARPRDLSHYETFEYFHETYYKQVEALSLTPFAPRALDRGLTGVLASLIRSTSLEFNENSTAQKVKPSDELITELGDRLTRRAHNVTNAAEVREFVDAAIQVRMDEWGHEASITGRKLGYRSSRAKKKSRKDEKEKPDQKSEQIVGLLREPSAQRWGMFTTPTSLREVEPTVRLLLRSSNPPEAPEWEAPPVDEGGKE